MSKHLRVAVVGAGPAGIYASDILVKSELPEGYESVTVDILEADPTPFGLIRYGVAPDHPRIKEIVKALHRVMSQDNVRFFGNVVFGKDVDLADLHGLYDAVVFATGARRDRALDIPGIDLDGSYGAADFVSWYDGHPEAPRDWPFDPAAESVAVIGVGNVALDVARILAKTADELLTTDIPDNVYRGLRTNATKDVHVFARRGPAQAKFSPMELRELNHSPNIDVIVHGEGFEFDAGSEQALRDHKAQKLVVDVLFRYLDDYMEGKLKGAAHRIHIHFLQNPVEVLGEEGKVVALRTEITEFDGTGNVRGTGTFVDTPVQAVYRAVGYYSDALAGLPFDSVAGVVPNDGGRVLLDGAPVPRTYVTGWIKRGPVGLIGHTKSDAQETVRRLLEDAAASSEMGVAPGDVTRFLEERDVAYTTWDGWLALDHHERHLGGAARERVKVVPREEMVKVARAL